MSIIFLGYRSETLPPHFHRSDLEQGAHRQKQPLISIRRRQKKKQRNDKKLLQKQKEQSPNENLGHRTCMCCPGEGAEADSLPLLRPSKIKSLLKFQNKPLFFVFFQVQVCNKFSSLLGKSQWKKKQHGFDPVYLDFPGSNFVRNKKKRERSGEDSRVSRINPKFFKTFAESVRSFKSLFFSFSDALRGTRGERAGHEPASQCAFLSPPQSQSEYPAKKIIY